MMYPTQIIGYVGYKKLYSLEGKREEGEGGETDRQRRIDKEKEKEREKID